MSPTIILIRHAQAEHNVAKDYALHDPPLTKLGFGEQCDELAKVLENDIPLANKIDLIVVSPMRRTLQTATQGLGWLMKQGVPVVLRAEWQENSAKPCDTGTSIDVMSKEWPQYDWTTVDPEYPSKEGLYEFSERGLTERGIAARKWLKKRPEKVIAVVSHSGFLRVGVSYRGFQNADFRIFEFEESTKHDDIGGKLVEWEFTEKNGGGLGKSPKGVQHPGPLDWPAEKEKIPAVGEAADEAPKNSL